MALAAILYNKANLYFLQSQGGPIKVAQYSVTWELVDGISILVSNLLLRSILYPLFVRLWKNNRQEFARLANNSVRWLIGASLPIMFVLFIESDRLIGLIYGGAYYDAMWMQKWLVGTILCGFIHNLAAYLMMSQGKQRLLLFIYIGGLAVNLVLCATLIPANPLLGTCLAMLITKAAVAVTTTTYCQATMRIFDVKSMWRIAVASACGAALYFATYRFGIREIPEILALLPFVILARQWWRELKAQKAHVGLA
jgi:O-antigen/teichoic acid export membrane protein